MGANPINPVAVSQLISNMQDRTENCFRYAIFDRQSYKIIAYSGNSAFRLHGTQDCEVSSFGRFVRQKDVSKTECSANCQCIHFCAEKIAHKRTSYAVIASVSDAERATFPLLIRKTQIIVWFIATDYLLIHYVRLSIHPPFLWPNGDLFPTPFLPLLANNKIAIKCMVCQTPCVAADRQQYQKSKTRHRIEKWANNFHPEHLIQ